MSLPVSYHIEKSVEVLRAHAGTRLHFGWTFGWAGVATVIFGLGQVIGHQIRPRGETFRFWAGSWARSIFGMGALRVRTRRATTLDPSKPYVFVCNHQNSLDILATLIAIDVPFTFAAKADLKNVPMLGWAMDQSPCIWVDRSTPRKAVQSIRDAGERIRSGTSVLIFPEGERTYSNEVFPMLKGAFQLALEAGVPLVPVVIHDAYKYLDERRYVSRPGVIHVDIGEPIGIEGATRRDLPEIMERFAQTFRAELASGH
ncbi:MAG: lysophospholipid acyltransferase family protein [Bacteroidota bacterium]